MVVVRVMLNELRVDASGSCAVDSMDLVMSHHLVVMMMASGGGAASCPTHHEVIRLHVMVNQMVVWITNHVERMLKFGKEIVIIGVDGVRSGIHELYGHLLRYICRVLLLLMVMMLLLLLLLLMLLCDIIAQRAQFSSLTTILL